MNMEDHATTVPSITLCMTRDISSSRASALDQPGIYILFWAEQLDQHASDGGSSPDVELVPICTGRADENLRAEISNHVLGSADTSLQRAALGLMLRERLGLILEHADNATGFKIKPEQRLTEWIMCNTVIGYANVSDADASYVLTAFESGIMNVEGCTPAEISERIDGLVQGCRAKDD